MRRAGRLFRIVRILRHRRVVTAAWMAEELEVSERTIYRDIQDLSLSGRADFGRGREDFFRHVAEQNLRALEEN